VLLWGSIRIRNAIGERDAAMLQQQRERDLLSTTLASIGDCVIVTDVDGRITFINPVASAVTGWTLEEAKGQPVENVFRIISEETREPVLNPVEKVIRRGAIVGLANHTVLIRKDGSEVPIDDSAAPVRTPHGKLEGVVLVFRDFSAAKKAQRELRAAKDAAEEANRAKDTFLAMLSHELRTPLTPVLATLQAWDMAGTVPNELKKDVFMLRRNVELEARLINDLLDLTRISRGVLSFHPETVDVHAILQLLVAMTRSEAERKRLNLEVNLKATRRFVNTDASRLQQVLWNIIRNAVNFTDANGTVSIETVDEGERLNITITDSGVGMSRDTLEKIFMPFEQADRARSVRHGGLGLGLAISRALVEQMGGQLDAASAGLGHGSKFTLRLELVGKTAATSPRRVAPVRSGPRRILLVEDHGDTALALARLLKMRGHEVSTVSTVEHAQAQLKNDEFDLLICDIGLPDGTGYELIKAVRSRSRIAAIAVTGLGMQSDVDKAIAAGFDAHLTKPIDLHKLEAAITQAEEPDGDRSGF
jgi:PAS domain S-box